MPPQDPVWASQILALAVVLIAGGLTARQALERSRRAPELPEAEALHFRRQDARRLFGAAVMVLLALGLVVGVRINPRVDRVHRWLFAGVWLGVVLLLVLLLVLAWADWMATIAYARRQRKALADERRHALASLRREPPPYPSNGHPSTNGPAGTGPR